MLVGSGELAKSRAGICAHPYRYGSSTATQATRRCPECHFASEGRA